MSSTAYDCELLRQQMARLRRAAADRQRLEAEIPKEYAAEEAAARSEADTASAAVTSRIDAEVSAARREQADALEKAEADLAAKLAKLDAQRKDHAGKIARSWQGQDRQLREDATFEETQALEVHKDRRKEPTKALRRAEKELAALAAAVADADTRSLDFLRRLGIAPPEPPAAAPESAPEPLPTGSALLAALEQWRGSVGDTLQALVNSKTAARAFSSGTAAAAVLLSVALGGAAAAATFFLVPATLAGSTAAKAGAAAAVFLVLGAVGTATGFWFIGSMRRAARADALGLRADLTRTIDRIRGGLEAAATLLKSRHDGQIAKLDATFAEQAQQRRGKSQADLESNAAKRDRQNAELASQYSEAAAKARAKAAAAREEAERTYPPRVAALERQRVEQVATIERSRDDRLAAASRHRDDRWQAMVEDWRRARTETAAVYDEAARIDDAAFRPWEDLARDEVPLPAEAPPGLRFGQLALALDKVPGGVSARPELNAFGPVAWSQPAIVPFPVEASLLIKTTAEQKEIASDMMQALMLRIASGIPAGQSRFTIVDPLGLGKQFAGFMHLADFDELLVTSRIWTEPPQIEQRLADITEQIEMVIQKYLRNEYASIGDYNAAAEVPEPYRFVVVANFPANFTETSARRLASIATSGARCGVYTIVSVDTSQHLPANFSLADLEKHATTLVLADGTPTWVDPEFSRWPLAVERPPSDEVFTRIVHRVGKAAQAAKRVEVPFDRVAPKEGEWWTESTAKEVVAPLGPAGAKKTQELRLGKGTSQHALIAGKTGSGKSTLMHALITSLALKYSPNEIQFYLIDFKKGVEFKLYDHYRLPHARVIAIESEREFGLSVLEQLDRELKRRGDRFRDLSVQDVAGFRAASDGEPMPRILLIIDEFQEIFVEDDKIAQDAALILDRLVRQGRAFGMHVILGSQTLGGSYSLPRATMGQMAVRVALQCNEADSSLILSEDNTAARLLTRPGEAIYNDANGMVAGNSPFQVVFLNDKGREHYLGALRALADRRTDIPQLPRMVFDGNEAADPTGNRLLAELLGAGTVRDKPPYPPQAWLGDAIAIKDPTAAVFRRQGGANLLVVGQREDLGTSLLAMALVSLAAAHDPHPGGGLGHAARFVIFEPAIADEKPEIMLANLLPWVPHETELVGRLAVGEAVQRLADEVRRRIDGQVLDGEAVYVLIRDLARFRELRRDENDFGFSGVGGEQKATPAQNLVTLLKDGPPVGVHLLVWCDSLTNLQRAFDRGTLKEFELRVLFQMSGSDSSQLVDSPTAVKLGPQRALFVQEETGTLEKFRPYAFPTEAWLGQVSAALRARPQGTPGERPATSSRPAASQPASPAPAGERVLDFQGGFGADEFNFAKYLDDPPPADPGT